MFLIQTMKLNGMFGKFVFYQKKKKKKTKTKYEWN